MILEVLPCSQIWLISLVDDCQCGVHHKIEKKKPCHQREACPSILRTCLLLICSLASKSSIAATCERGQEDLVVQSTHVTWHNKSCIFCMQWYYHTQNWREESPISQNLNAKWSFFLGVKRGYKVWKNYLLEFLSDYGQERRLLSTLTESGAVTRLFEHIMCTCIRNTSSSYLGRLIHNGYYNTKLRDWLLTSVYGNTANTIMFDNTQWL